MPSLPSGPDGTKPPDRSDIVDPQFIPSDAGFAGDVFPDLVQAVEANADAITATLVPGIQAECEGLYAEVQVKLLQVAANCVAVCTDAIGGCVGCLTAQAESVAALVSPVVAKCQSKVSKAAGDRFALTMGYLGQLGLPWPDDAAVKAVAAGANVADVMALDPATLKATITPGGDVSAGPAINLPDTHPATAADIGAGDIPNCPPGYVTYVKDGQVVCLKPATATDPGEVIVSNGHGGFDHVDTIPPHGGGTGGGGTGGNTGGGTNTNTGGTGNPGYNCADGNTVVDPPVCFGDPTPEHVWYVVTCKPNGQYQLDTYHGWNKPNVAANSIIKEGPLESTPPPTETEIDVWAKITCHDILAQQPPPKPKPATFQSIDYCEYHDTQPTPPTVIPGELAASTTSGVTGFWTALGTAAAGGLIGLEVGGPPGALIGFIGTAIAQVVPGTADVVKSVLAQGLASAGQLIAPVLPCQSAQYKAAVAERLAIGIFDRFGMVPKAAVGNLDYTENYECQYILPSGGDAHQLATRGFITDESWKYLIKVNGLCVPWQEKVKEASYTQLGIGEAIAAYRREDLDVDEFRDAMRHAGVKDEARMDVYRHLADYVPGPGDIVTMMLRDVADNSVVTEYGLDDEFEDKWTDRLKDWSAWQGIDEQTMRFYWRGHWTWPSPEQLFQMMWRLRDPFVLEGTSETVEPVTADDVLKVLGINDYSPKWRARIAAIAYRVPMRREIGKLYETGVIDKEEAVDRFRDLGYQIDDAKALRDYMVIDSAERKAKYSGGPSRALVVKLFKADGLTYQQAYDLLLDAGVDVDAADGVLNNATQERDATTRAKMVSSLKRRFMSGEYSTSQVITKLQAYGVATDRIQAISGQWQEEFSLKRREPTVAQLCDWAGRGYITTEEYMRRLNNLGYDATDASHFMTTCATVWSEKVIAGAKKAAREARAAEKEASRCRPAPKPYCSLKASRTRTHAVSSVNGSAPRTTDTTTDTETTG